MTPRQVIISTPPLPSDVVEDVADATGDVIGGAVGSVATSVSDAVGSAFDGFGLQALVVGITIILAVAGLALAGLGVWRATTAPVENS